MSEIDELIVAIGYALDASNPERDYQDRKECREIATRILENLAKMRLEAKEYSAKMARDQQQVDTFTK